MSVMCDERKASTTQRQNYQWAFTWLYHAATFSSRLDQISNVYAVIVVLVSFFPATCIPFKEFGK